MEHDKPSGNRTLYLLFHKHNSSAHLTLSQLSLSCSLFALKTLCAGPPPDLRPLSLSFSTLCPHYLYFAWWRQRYETQACLVTSSWIHILFYEFVNLIVDPWSFYTGLFCTHRTSAWHFFLCCTSLQLFVLSPIKKELNPEEYLS